MSAIVMSFAAEADFLGAADRLAKTRLGRMETYTPYPVDGLDAILPLPNKTLPISVFAVGIAGLAGGLFMQWYAVAISYPIDIGGRPPGSWPAFIPIAFEIAVLCAVLACFLGFCILTRLPAPYQRVAAIEGFERATQDRFFIILDDPSGVASPARIAALIHEFEPCTLADLPP